MNNEGITKESRQGKPQDGWVRQGVQLPSDLCRKFREESADLGYGGVKYLGSAAIAIVLGLEQVEQKALAGYVRDKTWNDASGLEPSRVLHMINMMHKLPAPAMARYLQTASVDADYDKEFKVWKEKEEEIAKMPRLIDVIVQNFEREEAEKQKHKNNSEE